MLTNIKKYSIGAPIQAAVDALLNIRRDNEVGADDVEGLVVTLPERLAPVVYDRDMPDINLQ